MRILFFTLFVILLVPRIYSQNFYHIPGFNVSAGLSYQTLEYINEIIFYSPGGGAGIEYGVGTMLNKNLEGYATIGYQQNLAFRYNNDIYGEYMSSFTFNRKYVVVGGNLVFRADGSIFKGIKFGGGLNYHIPGKVRITELNYRLGSISYRSTGNLHLNITGIFDFSENTPVYIGLRFRSMKFLARDYEGGSVLNLPGFLRNLNATGIDMTTYFNLPFKREKKPDAE